jgi:N-acetylglutamate synthase-like GNAT family acetyltransferase
MDLAISVRRATRADAASLTVLVNRAYEIEAFFVDGDRTSEREVAELADKFVVLERAGGLAAAVHLDVNDSGGGCISMLSVDPELQGRGLGTRLVRVAEAMFAASACTEVALRFINLRDDLDRWYRSLGYRVVGTAPYQHRATKRPCHFVEMRRSI